MQTNRSAPVLLINVQQKISILKIQITQLKVDNARLMSNNVFMIKKLESVRKYEKMMKMKRIDFETSIVDSFYRFFSEKSINENANNSKMKHSFLIFSDDLTKTLKEIFRGIYNNLSESSSFEDDLSPTTSHA